MLDVRDVTVAFDGTTVLHGINLSVEQGEIVCLLGPSGCGKTTLLRAVTGLETLAAGDVQVEGQSVTDVPVYERDFGLMFQDFALFPHMDVLRNVTFGLRMRGVASAQRDARAREVLTLVGLADTERRDVTTLSGGEKQRVALARSLAPNPRLLLLDEPLGSLDAALKSRLVVELRQIIKRLGLTAIYVTHDQEEAYAIADRVAVMNAGRIEQVDTPETLYMSPHTAFVARFLGLHNVVPVLSVRDGKAETSLGTFNVDGTPDSLLLHPDGLSVASEGDSASITGRLEECVFAGDHYDLRVQTDADADVTLTFAVNRREVMPNVGETVRVTPSIVLGLEGT